MDSRTTRSLFAIGAAVGLVIALFTALGPIDTGPDDEGLAARVGDGGVSRASYEQAIAALEADKRNPLTAADRARALDRLIDEELLVRRGIELGLPASDPAVRKAIVDAMIQFATAGATDRAPTDAELRRFYDSRPSLFRSAAALRVAAAALPTDDQAAAERFIRRLADGTPFETAAAAEGAPLLSIPNLPLSPGKLTDYAGPTVRDIAIRLAPGEAAVAVEDGGRLVVVQLRERRPGERSPFDAVRPEVEEAWRRVERDHALERYLTDLRRGTTVVKR